MSQDFIVSKFGGTSMGNLSAMQRSAQICVEHNSNLIVVSATSGTTDKLTEIANLATVENILKCEEEISSLKKKHLDLFNQVSTNSEALEDLNNCLTELELLLHNVSRLKEVTPKAFDNILSIGERLSSIIFKEVLKKLIPDKKIILLDARTIIKTDSNFGKAVPQILLIEKNCKKLNPDYIYITQGFIGADAKGNTTVLGRGGSDFSAALFAEGLGAKILEIWTDVAGIATTDPRICERAKIIDEISYAEAGEMAQYGAKILHPATISPAIRKSIPIFVGSSFDKNLPGTWIKEKVEDRPVVRSITKRNSQSLLTITNPDMLNAFGFMGKIFDIFGKYRISVDCVTTSEISIAVTIDHIVLLNEKFMKEIESVGKISVEDGYSLISLIGNNLFSRSSLAKKIFESIETIPVRMTSFGASDYNFNFLVSEEVAVDCIKKLHSRLIESEV